MFSVKNIGLTRIVKKHRAGISRVFFAIIFIIVILGRSPVPDHGLTKFYLEILACVGKFLVLFAILGRLWTSIYISGYKNNELVQVGPYSIMRNPLYIFSLLGFFGLGLATESLVVTLAILIFFALFYPFVISIEEKSLQRRFGEKFLDYKNRVPGFIPNFRLYQSPSQYTVMLSKYFKSIRDVSAFLLMLVGLEVVKALHTYGILHPLFYLW